MKKSLTVGIISLFILSAVAPLSLGYDVKTSYTDEIQSEGKNNLFWDLLWDNGNPDGVNALPCVYYSSFPLEQQVIDDFYLDLYEWNIMGGEFSIIIESIVDPYVDPEDVISNVKVLFYNSSGLCEPNITPFAEQYVKHFVAYLTGNYFFDKPEIKVAVDINPAVYLTPGDYWVCFQLEIEDNCFWLTTSTENCSVFLYDSVQYPKWTSGYNVYNDYYDVSFLLAGAWCPCPPRICSDGFLNWQNVKPGDNVSGTFEIYNCGDEDSLLDWECVSHPYWGDWNIYPDNGTKLGDGERVTINVNVTAPEFHNWVYSGKIKIINSYTPLQFCEIDVVLSTQRNRVSYSSFWFRFFDMFPILQRILDLMK